VPYVGEYDEMNIWTKESKEKYKQKVNIRKEQEAIESENIKQFIEAGQK
jgi:predicted membrane protein